MNTKLYIISDIPFLHNIENEKYEIFTYKEKVGELIYIKNEDIEKTIDFFKDIHVNIDINNILRIRTDAYSYCGLFEIYDENVYNFLISKKI